MHASGTVAGRSLLGKLPSISIAPCLRSSRTSLFLLCLHHAPLLLPSPSRNADPRALSSVTQGSFHLTHSLNMHSAEAWPGPSSELLALAPLLPLACSPGISNPVSAKDLPQSPLPVLPSLEKGLPLIRKAGEKLEMEKEENKMSTVLAHGSNYFDYLGVCLPAFFLCSYF